jgi:hypothetical protein
MTNLVRYQPLRLVPVSPAPDPRIAQAVFSRTFEGRTGLDFSALNDALEFLWHRGFSVGPGCVGHPQGIMYGRWKIAKWYNLDAEECGQLHGILSGERRRGPVLISIFMSAPAFAIAAVASPGLAESFNS